MSDRDPDCVFCKIVAGEIPSARVYESDRAVAFLDIQPVNKGHLLVVARSHHPTLADLPDELAAHVGSLLPRLCRAVRDATGVEGYNVIVNNGRAAGQTIGHVHWHLIPRSIDDDVHWPWPHRACSGDELERIRTRIEGALTNPPEA